MDSAFKASKFYFKKVNELKKINALIRYEFINLRRGVLIWIIPILYAIGIQQQIYGVCFNGHTMSLVGLIGYSWVPLNFIMIPLLLISMKVGKSDSDIFKVINISHKEEVLSKAGVLLVIDAAILSVNIILGVVIGIMSNVTLTYFLYQTFGYILNTIIFLIVCNIIGLFVGQVICKNAGEVLGFIIIIILFIILCNFYKLSNIIVPVIDIRVLPTYFDVISYDKSYLFHILFWIIMSSILFLAFYMNKYKHTVERKTKVVFIQKTALIAAGCMCICLAIGSFVMSPKFYDIRSRYDAGFCRSNDKTFYSKDNCGYYVDKYIMDLSIDDILKNNCQMNVNITGNNVTTIELGLYDGLNIKQVEIDGKTQNFQRTGNSFIVKLPKMCRSGDTVSLNIKYEGRVKTTWFNGEELFFSRSNGVFLADVFEWYPKLNDTKEKKYILNVKYNGGNNLYSNLDGNIKRGQYRFSGKDEEICLAAGNIEERKYKGYLFIGNQECIKNDKMCDDIIDGIKINNTENTKENNINANKIVIAPSIPGGTKMDGCYEKAYLKSVDH